MLGSYMQAYQKRSSLVWLERPTLDFKPLRNQTQTTKQTTCKVETEFEISAVGFYRSWSFDLPATRSAPTHH